MTQSVCVMWCDGPVLYCAVQCSVQCCTVQTAVTGALTPLPAHCTPQSGRLLIFRLQISPMFCNWSGGRAGLAVIIRNTNDKCQLQARPGRHADDNPFLSIVIKYNEENTHENTTGVHCNSALQSVGRC